MRAGTFDIEDVTTEDGRVVLSLFPTNDREDRVQTRFVVNQTNAMNLAIELGTEDMTEWIGKTISVSASPVSIAGRRLTIYRVYVSEEALRKYHEKMALVRDDLCCPECGAPLES